MIGFGFVIFLTFYYHFINPLFLITLLHAYLPLNLLIFAYLAFHFRTLLPTVLGTLQIFNLAEEHVAMVTLGEARVLEGTAKILHKINITLLKESLVSWQNVEFRTDSKLHALFLHKVEQIQRSLNQIQPLYLSTRRKRSFDSLGSGWKWLAGSPDADDLQSITEALSEIETGSKEQMLLNDYFSDVVKNITFTLEKVAKNSIQDLDNLYEKVNTLEMLLELEYIENQINYIQDSVLFSKFNVLNHNLLSNEELDFISNYLIQQKLVFQTLDHALKFASVSIVAKEELLVYSISLPQLMPEAFDLLRIEALSKNQQKLVLPGKIFLKGNQSLMVQMKECDAIDELRICKRTDLAPVKELECLPNILKGLPSKCDFLRSSSVPDIVEMASNTILVTNANYTVENTCGSSDRILRGTYLISFPGCSVCVQQNCFYDTLLKEYQQVFLPPTNGLPVRRKSLLHQADLGVIHESHAEILHSMRHFHKRTKLMEITTWSSLPTIGLIVILISAMMWYLHSKVKPQNMVITLTAIAEEMNKHKHANSLNQEVHV